MLTRLVVESAKAQPQWGFQDQHRRVTTRCPRSVRPGTGIVKGGSCRRADWLDHDHDQAALGVYRRGAFRATRCSVPEIAG